nr:class I SAM-dependent methyltransferase [Pseudonocardia acidicola]
MDHAAVVSRMGPNPHLVAEAADLAPGRALDAGCGNGAEAVWLAERGWHVTAVDIATTALCRARKYAEEAGVANRIDWVEADLTDWTPPEDHFELVTTHYVHPAASHGALFDRLAAWVAPGGTLLVVGHRATDERAVHGHAPPHEATFTAEDSAAGLDRDQWDIAAAEARTRTVTGSDGQEMTLHDAVLRARKRP